MSYWSKRMGQPQRAPQNLNLPRGIGSNPQQAVEHYVGNLPAFQGPPEAAQAPVAAGPPPGSMEEALQRAETRGDLNGAATKDNIGACPRCGSFRYMARANGWSVTTQSGQILQPSAKCFDCGYPDEQGVLAVAAKAQGPVASSRQGAMMPMLMSPQQNAT